MISTFVDDFGLAGKNSFVDMTTENVSVVLDVPKEEDDKFRFTGVAINFHVILC